MANAFFFNFFEEDEECSPIVNYYDKDEEWSPLPAPSNDESIRPEWETTFYTAWDGELLYASALFNDESITPASEFDFSYSAALYYPSASYSSYGAHHSSYNIYNSGDWEEHHIRLHKNSKELEAPFDLLKRLWGLLDIIIDLMQSVRVYVILILKTVFSGFFEFPNSMRPPCTTMPWTIWPSLVVLWGVCWMFYTPLNPADERQFELSLQDHEWPPFSISEVPLDPLRASVLTNQGFPNDLGLENLISPPTSFEWWNEVDFTDFQSPGESNKAHNALFGEVVPSLLLVQGGSSKPASPLDIFEAHNSVEQRLATTLTEGHFARPSNSSSAMTRSTGASTQVETPALPPQASSSFTRPEQPPQNSQGEIICDHVNCSYKNIIFNTRHDWLKHKNKHERPYKCTVDGCTRPEGFATKGDQLRHERTVHKAPNNLVGMEVSTSPSLFCNEPNCPRGPGTGISGFNRRDNLLDHMRRRHGRAFASSRAAAMNSPTPPTQPTPALPQLEGQQVTSLVAVSGKRRRSPTASMLDMNEIQGTNPPKKPRQEESSPQIAMEQTLRDENLVREVERLRKELEKAQKEKDVLMGVIDRLMQRPT